MVDWGMLSSVTFPRAPLAAVWGMEYGGTWGQADPSHTGALRPRPQVAVEVIQAVMLSLGESSGDRPALTP